MGLPFQQIMQYGLPLLTGMGQQAAEGEARAMNEDRYDEGLGLIRNLNARQRIGYGSLMRNTTDLYKDAGGEQSRWFDKLQALSKRRGRQEKKDLHQRFQNEEAKTRAGLAAQGMGGTTIAPTMRRGLLREKGAELGRLDERLTGRKMSLMDARRRTMGKHAYGLTDVYQQLKQQRLMTDAASTGREVNWIGDREDVYPSQAAYLNLMQNYGQGQAPTPEQPGTDYLTAIGAPVAGGIAGGATLGLMLSDAAAKEGFEAIDAQDVLEQIQDMEIATWQYIEGVEASDGGVRHIGPTAQEFQKQTGFGSGKTIPIIDALGVLFAGLGALADTVEKLVAERN